VEEIARTFKINKWKPLSTYQILI